MAPQLGDEGSHVFTIELNDGVETYKHDFEIIATIDGEGPVRTDVDSPKYYAHAVTGSPKTFDMNTYFEHTTGGLLTYSYIYYEEYFTRLPAKPSYVTIGGPEN